MKRSYALAASTAIGAAAGAFLMFFLDPDSGARRRAAARDRSRHGYRAASSYVRRASTNVANHARGLAATVGGPFRSTDIPADEVLLARVRARIGHVVSHPHAVDVKADHGSVLLSGKVPYREAEKLLKTVARTRGVCALENHLAISTTA